MDLLLPLITTVAAVYLLYREVCRVVRVADTSLPRGYIMICCQPIIGFKVVQNEGEPVHVKLARYDADGEFRSYLKLYEEDHPFLVQELCEMAANHLAFRSYRELEIL